jgi:hypothetical protein
VNDGGFETVLLVVVVVLSGMVAFSAMAVRNEFPQSAAEKP